MNGDELQRRVSITEDPPIDRILSPFRSFIHAEASSGILLMGAALVALVWANSPWAESYTHLWEIHVSIDVGGFEVSESLLHWINDGLMAMFFFVVGLEIKRELLVGELASPRLAALPLLAAMGGMLVPAAIYVGINLGTPEAHGWGVPMATDIAFSLGILYLLGSRVPGGLKVFLASLAIADDLGAVIAIAFFYTSDISYLSLLEGAGVLAFAGILNLLGVRSPLVYGIFGIGGVWLAFLFSGVHPTIAGVLMAMMIPASMRIHPQRFVDRGRAALDRFERAGDSPTAHTLTSTERQNALYELDLATDFAMTPLQRLEKGLHPWVTFLVLPLFALANAGVTLEGDITALLFDRLTLGIVFGLVIGKQVGVTLFSWLAVRLGMAQLPAGVTWRHLYGVSWLAGIGFTMSLFIGGLAFTGESELAMAKVGVLGGSLIAGVVGVLILRRT